MTNYDPYFHTRPTAGEMPATRPTTAPLTQSPYSVVNPITPMPPVPPAAYGNRPLNPPLSHVNVRGDDPTFLLSSQQKAMIRAKDDIIQVLDLNCRCDKCENGVLIILSDLISDLLTDQTVTNLSFHKLERAIKQLTERMDHYGEKVDFWVEGKR